MDIKILIAENNCVFRNIICKIVKSQGYVPIEASDGNEAVDIFFKHNDVDLIILDIMLPGYSGFEVLNEIRDYSDAPIIMLTDIKDEKHEILALNKGADEYISKQFSYELFIARLNNMVNKIKKHNSKEIIAGKLKINQNNHKVMLGNLEVKLDSKEYKLLLYFINNINKVLTRNQILDKIWGYDFEGDIRTIDTHVKTLRAKLSHSVKYIKTVRGTGYMFEVAENENK